MEASRIFEIILLSVERYDDERAVRDYRVPERYQDTDALRMLRIRRARGAPRIYGIYDMQDLLRA